MDESVPTRKNKLNQILLVAILVMAFFEIWVTSRRLYFLEGQGNSFGSQSVLMHIVFRYIGAIVGAYLFIGIPHLLKNKKTFPPEGSLDDGSHGECKGEAPSTDVQKTTQHDTKKVSKVLLSLFLGMTMAFVSSRQASEWHATEFPVESPSTPSSRTQNVISPLSSLGSDAAVDIMMKDFMDKSPGYRILVDEDVDFRDQLRGLFRAKLGDKSSPSEMAKKDAEFKTDILDLMMSMNEKYVSYASDKAVIDNMIATEQLADYFSRAAPEGCRGLVSGNSNHFAEVPGVLKSAAREAGSAMLVSGLRNFKAGKTIKPVFSGSEFLSFLNSKAKSAPDFKLNVFLKLYDPGVDTSAQDVCQAILSWSNVRPNETPRTLGEFYRTILLGTSENRGGGS